MALTNATVYTGDDVFDDRAVVVDGGMISSLPTDLDEARFPGEIIDLTGLSLAPGLIDLQVNGGGDRLFNESQDVETLQAMAAAHVRHGTTDIMATFTTGPQAGMRRAARAVREANEIRLEGFLGVHFEGPLLSPDHRGVHNPQFLRHDLEGQLPDDLSSVAGSCPTIVTLAPEVVPAGFIAALHDRGVVVSAGHTQATPQDIRRAVAEGLRAGTHVWNGMPPICGRTPGPVGALLSDPNVWCGFIADGHHLDTETLAFSLAVNSPRRSILVSDAMASVGGTTDAFTLEGVQITRTGDRCETADGGLAGAAVPLIEGVRRCVEVVGVPLDEALRMATLYPAECLGVADRRGRVAAGYPAHLVALDPLIRPVAVITGSRLHRLAPSPSTSTTSSTI